MPFADEEENDNIHSSLQQAIAAIQNVELSRIELEKEKLKMSNTCNCNCGTKVFTPRFWFTTGVSDEKQN